MSLMHRAAGDVAMALIGVFGLLKLIDLSEFRVAIAQWSIIPPSLQPALTVAVPSIELLLAGTWFVLGRHRRIARASLILVAVFTAGLVVEGIIHPEVPGCGCLGPLLHKSRFDTVYFGLVRNLVLMACLIAVSLPHPEPTSASCLNRPITPERAAAGFTLLEVLCVILLIGLLAALLMPTLQAVRRVGRQAVSLTNLRSHASVFATYTNDFREAWPYYTSPDATYSVLRSARNSIARTVVYFGLYNRWHLAMLDAYYDGQARAAVLNQPYSPGHLAAGAYGWSTYQYSCSFLASPEFWDYTTREAPDRPQLRATRTGEVTWPAAKALVVGFYSADADLRPESQSLIGLRELAFVDGHARTIPSDRLLHGYVTQEGVGSPRTRHAATGTAEGLHTLGGVRGRDMARGD